MHRSFRVVKGPARLSRSIYPSTDPHPLSGGEGEGGSVRSHWRTDVSAKNVQNTKLADIRGLAQFPSSDAWRSTPPASPA